ncbi:MAG: hypothetical protein ACE5G9_08785 [Nitrospinales bacterium]
MRPNLALQLQEAVESGKSYLNNAQGVVLIVALVLLAVMLTLGSLMARNMATEISISGNYETNTRSLFVAEGGLEIAKGEISGNISGGFTADGYSSGNSQEYEVEYASIPMTTLTNPVNWLGTSSGWSVNKTAASNTLMDTVASTDLDLTNATWPLYKKVAIGADFAVVSLERPEWFSSNPTKVRFSITSETDNLANTNLLNRKVTGTFEVNMGNNFLTFQTFSDPADNQTFIDNIANNFVVIGSAGTHYGGAGAGNDYGIDAASDAIAGIWTYDLLDKILIIQKCTGGTPGSFSGCAKYGKPELNTTNRTFMLGGSGHGCLFGVDPSDPDATAATITVTAGEKYKLKYVTSVTCP